MCLQLYNYFSIKIAIVFVPELWLFLAFWFTERSHNIQVNNFICFFEFAVTNSYDGLKARRRHPPRGTRRGRPRGYKAATSANAPPTPKESPNGKSLWGMNWM